MDFLTLYKEYTKETESSDLFNTWVGISTIASALQKKTWLQLGRLKIFPNLYIILVAAPGTSRKSQSITYASELISEVQDIKVSADSLTIHALLQDLESAITYTRVNDGQPFRHCSLSVISKEFESFFSDSKKMVVTLTDLFDAGETPWKHKTKDSTPTLIPSVFLNILGATTPHSLQTCLPSLAVGGGLTSRIIFVCSKTKKSRIAIPTWNAELEKMKVSLVERLQQIVQISGAFEYSSEALDFWVNWYEKDFVEDHDKRIQSRVEFDGWYSRKPLLLQKLSIILSASESDKRVIMLSHVKKAIMLLEEVEHQMGDAISNKLEKFSNEMLYDSEVIYEVIERHKKISEKHLLQIIWRTVNDENFDRSIDVLLNKNKVKRVFESPTGKDEIWYHLTKEESNEHS